MPWQVFVIFYFIFAVSREIFTRWYVQRSSLSPQIISAISFSLGVLPLGIFVGLTNEAKPVDWSIWTIILLITVGFFIALHANFAYASKKLINIALYLTLLQVYVIVASILGWLLLGESLTLTQIMGGFLLLGGAYLAIRSINTEKQNNNSIKGAVLASLAGIALGVGLVVEKASIDQIGIYSYFIFGWGMQAIGTLVIALPKRNVILKKDFTKFDFFGAIVGGLLMGASGLMFISALNKVDNIGIMVLIASFNLPLSVLASNLILGEKDNSKLLIVALFISFAGLFITAF